MELHGLKNVKGAKTSRMRVGRGESSGKGRTSGKGNKGQMSRTGHKHKPLFEGILRAEHRRALPDARRRHHARGVGLRRPRRPEGPREDSRRRRSDRCPQGRCPRVQRVGQGQDRSRRRNLRSHFEVVSRPAN